MPSEWIWFLLGLAILIGGGLWIADRILNKEG